MPSNDDIRIVINGDYEHTPQADLARRLPQTGLPADAEIIYNARNRVVITADRQLCIKSYGVPGFVKGVIYGFFRLPKAHRAWDNAFRLAQAGISTPKPVAMVECRRHGLLTQSYYVTEVLEGWDNMRGAEHRSDFHELVRAFAKFIVLLHSKHIFMKDLTPGNVMFRPAAKGGFDFALVDINRMLFDISDRRTLMKNFRSPLDTRRGTEALAQSYAALTHPGEPGKARKCVEEAMKIYDNHQQTRALRRRIKNSFKR